MLEFQLCAAARTLSQFSSTSCAFQVAQSSVQGLRNGAHFGQCCTHFILKKLTTANPRVWTRVLVDDLSESTVGSERQ
eukprot:1604560-Pyramimonas_sp.AAC.1